MASSSLFLILILIVMVVYLFGRKRSEILAQAVGGVRNLHSLPNYYGLMAAVWAGVPGLLLLCAWLAFENTVIQNMVIAGMPDYIKSLPQS